MYKKILFLIVTLLWALSLQAATLYKVTSTQPFSSALHTLKNTLEKEHLYIVDKIDIGSTLASMKQKLGKDYNRHHFTKIKSIIFCNPFYANDVLNADPNMMALCPLKIMLLEKNGKTTALFLLPSSAAKHSPARKILKEVEQKVKRSLKNAGFR